MAKELSIFVDESGDRGGKARYLSAHARLHDQADGIAEAVTGYEAMLAYFSSFVRRLPISYVTFVYRRSQFEDPARLMERMGRDVSSAMVEHLGFFQSFDDVKSITTTVRTSSSKRSTVQWTRFSQKELSDAARPR